MSIKVKAVERNVSFDKSKNKASLIESIRPTQHVRARAAILVLSKFYG